MTEFSFPQMAVYKQFQLNPKRPKVELFTPERIKEFYDHFGP